MRDSCRRIFGSKIADQTGPVWGTDEQGEIQGVWRYSGHPGFWYMGGVGVVVQSGEQRITRANNSIHFRT